MCSYTSVNQPISGFVSRLKSDGGKGLLRWCCLVTAGIRNKPERADVSQTWVCPLKLCERVCRVICVCVHWSACLSMQVPFCRMIIKYDYCE